MARSINTVVIATSPEGVTHIFSNMKVATDHSSGSFYGIKKKAPQIDEPVISRGWTYTRKKIVREGDSV